MCNRTKKSYNANYLNEFGNFYVKTNDDPKYIDMAHSYKLKWNFFLTNWSKKNNSIPISWLNVLDVNVYVDKNVNVSIS